MIARVVLGALAIVGIAALELARTDRHTRHGGRSRVRGQPAQQVPRAAGPGQPDQAIPDSPALSAEGFNLYQESCSSCHGIALQGTPGVAPSLIGVGPGPVDFYLSTGGCRSSSPRDEPLRTRPRRSPARRSMP